MPDIKNGERRIWDIHTLTFSGLMNSPTKTKTQDIQIDTGILTWDSAAPVAAPQGIFSRLVLNRLFGSPDLIFVKTFPRVVFIV